MKDPKRIWAWVGVAIVVIAVAVWAALQFKQKPVAPVVTGPVPVFAPKGQLTPNFPKDLIIDSSAAIGGSYSINYSSSTNQYTAGYTSSSTVSTLYKDYQSYLTQHNWTVTGSLTTHPTFDAIAATQGNNQLQVVISTQGGQNKGSQVTITYVVK
jgi:hypothetical protein